MPLPTTLLDFATGEKSRYETLEAEAASALATAREDLAGARSDLRDHSDTLSEAREQAESLRSRLSRISTPGDGEDLLDRLTDAFVEARRAMRGVHRSRARIRDARIRMEAAASRRERAARRLGEAEEALEEARSRKELRDGWSSRLGREPLSSVKSDADDLLTGSGFTARSDEVEAAIPEKLRQAALKRRELEELRREHARELEALATDLLDAESPDPAAEEETEYRRARSALAEYVRRAGEELSRARTFLEGEMPEIGDGEEEDLADLAADGAPAAELEIALTEARIDEETRRFELRKAELGALADPSQDPSVVGDAEDALSAAVSDREDALAAYDVDDHPRQLERWELTLPDEVWSFFLRFHEVADSLGRLAGLDPSDLESDLDDAEKALAEARHEAAERRRRLRELGVRRKALEARRRGTEETFDARMLSAVRGDG